MSKFKIGDRVVVVSDNWDRGYGRTEDCLQKWESFEIKCISSHFDGRTLYWDDNNMQEHNAEFCDTIELESVVNSPLYKALR